MGKIVTVVDLGSSKIAAAAADIAPDGNARILALGNISSRGVACGNIKDMARATEDISSVIGKLRRNTGRKLNNIYVTTRGNDIRMELERGMIPLSGTPREIAKRDVKKCLAVAAMIKFPLDRVVMENVVNGFYVDGISAGVKNPVGLYGIKLEAEMMIVTASLTRIQNITKCVDMAGLVPIDVRLSSLASAESILEGEEKEKGVIFMDIGSELTEILFFKDDALKNYKVIEKGASAVLDRNSRVDDKKLYGFLSGTAAALSSGQDKLSVVVAGGGAFLDGVVEETEKVFGVPARMGIVKEAGRRALSSQDAIIHTSTIGLINRLAKEYKYSHIHKNLIHGMFRKMADIYESYF